jgi:hypothetical protein
LSEEHRGRPSSSVLRVADLVVLFMSGHQLQAARCPQGRDRSVSAAESAPYCSETTTGADGVTSMHNGRFVRQNACPTVRVASVLNAGRLVSAGSDPIKHAPLRHQMSAAADGVKWSVVR